MAYPETLPDSASLNETGHIDDHNQIVQATRNIDERLHTVEIAPAPLSTEQIQDMIGTFLVAGAGVTLNYNDAAGTLTITATGSGVLDAEGAQDAVGTSMSGAGLVSVDYDDTAGTITVTVLVEDVQDLVGTMLAAGAGLSVNYDDTAGTIAIANTDRGSVALAGRTVSTGTGLSGGGDLSADRTLAVDVEWLMDYLNLKLVGGTNVTLNYDDDLGVITVSASGGTLTDGAVSTIKIADDAVTFAKMQNVTGPTLLGRVSGSGDISPLTQTEARKAVGGALYGYFDVRNYGGVLDGSTDDADAIDAAIVALTAAGGGILMVSGRSRSSRSHTVGSTIPCTLMGLGAGARLSTATAPSCVTFTSTTSTGFDLRAKGSRAVDIALAHAAFNETTLGVTGTKPTAGFGLRFGDTTASSGDGMHLTRVLVQGFYTNVDIDNATEFGMDGCQIWAPVHTNVRLRNTTEPDFGDATFTGCWFIPVRSYANAAYNVRWESGGGLKLIGCKFNSGASSAPYACDLSHVSMTAGTGTSTSILISEGTSYENYVFYAIDLLVSGTGTFDYVSINGGEVAPYTSGGAGFRIRGRSGHVLKQVSIQGVNMVGAGGGSVPITLDYCDEVLLGNTYTGWAGSDLITNCTNVRYQDRAFTSTAAGLVPASGGGTTTFLRADGIFAAPGGGGNYSGCTVYRSGMQSIPPTTATPIVWDVERVDTGSYHSTVTSPERFTAQEAGYYRLYGQVNVNSSGTTEVYVYPEPGPGVPLVVGANVKITVAGRTTAPFDTGVMYMDAGEYLTASVYVTSGTSVTVDNVGSFLTFERLGA